MKFDPVEISGNIIGYSSRHGDDLFFFGTELNSQPLLEEAFPNLDFYRIQQVHGDLLVESSKNLISADAHWSSRGQAAPIVATADCLPLLVSHPHFHCAIHAGWRGVKNEITLKALRQLLERFGGAEKTQVVIGPHIHHQSFEVDLGLALDFQKLFETYLQGHAQIYSAEHKNKKGYVDLRSIVKAQLSLCGVGPEQIFEFAADTMTDSRFASYRRQKASAKRNLSFVTRLGK